MLLFPPEPVIEPTDGFMPDKDIFGHKEFGERLECFYGNIDSSLVGVLHAPWGSGKSILKP